MNEGALQRGYRTYLHARLHQEQQHQHVLLVRLQTAFQQNPKAQARLCGLASCQQGLHTHTDATVAIMHSVGFGTA